MSGFKDGPFLSGETHSVVAKHGSPEPLTCIATSHSHPAAYDCGIYLQNRIPELRNVRFDIRSAGEVWSLVFFVELGTIKGEIDLIFAGSVCEIARAFITGRGGMCMPVRTRNKESGPLG